VSVSRGHVGSGLDLVVRDLGRMAYAEALALQRSLQQQVISGRESGATRGHLLLVEHDPAVITVSRRRGAREHLIATERQLADAGVEVAETDRGGDITYHGPGQLVAYPIVDLNVLGLRLHGYMRLLEQVVIDVLRRFGLDGLRDPDATGVWVGDEAGAATRKICAMGVRVSRWVTMHGLALNVTTDLRHFELIVPCGLGGRGVTSLRQEMGSAAPDMATVKRATVEAFGAAVAPPA
jgi:lipoyl(octanoyl) transferase